MILKKIISGGQTGADQAALVAAKKFGLETGGWMPKGFRTLEGPCPSMAEEFGMWEHPRSGYEWRTNQNVWKADATIRFARVWSSPGEKCTRNAIRQFQRPYLDIGMPDYFKDFRNLDGHPIPPEKAAEWLLGHEVKCLNVAGNSERTAPGIGHFVYHYLTEVFRLLAK